MKEIIITSSVLILVVLLLRRLLRGKISLRLQYALWVLVLLRLLLPVFPIESPVSLMNAAAPMANTAARVLGRMGYTPSGSALAQLDINGVFAEQQAPSGANQTKTSPGQAETPITLTRVLPGLWLAGAGAVGLCLLLAGVAMLFLPGQGVLTILIGICLMDIPGKRYLLDRLVSNPHIQRGLNWVRRKRGKPEFVFAGQGG